MKSWDQELDYILGFAAALRSVVEKDQFHGVSLSETIGIGGPFLLLRGGTLTAPGCRGIAPLIELAWHLTWIREVKRKIQHPGPAVHGGEGRILIEVESVQARCRALWEPLARSYGAENCILLAPKEEVRTQLPPEYPSVDLSQIPGDWVSTRLWLLGRIGRWRRCLQRVCRDFDLADNAPWRLMSFLTGQVALFSRAIYLMGQLKPAALVVPFDLSRSGVILCAAAKVSDVRTITLVHGALGRQNLPLFTPLQAEIVAVWGKVQADLFAETGVVKGCIWECGTFHNRPQKCIQPGMKRGLVKKIGLPEGKPIVVVGLTCLKASERMEWVKLLRAISRGLAGVSVLARLHPSNKVSDFSETAGSPLPENLWFEDDSMISTQESLELADAVLVDSSSFGMDAIERGVPVVVVAPPCGADYLGIMLEAAEAGAVSYAKDARHAVEALRPLLFERNVRKDLERKAEIFRDRYYCAYGDDAIARFKESLGLVVSGGSKKIASSNTDNSRV